jgi:hypothetical protein
MLQNMWPIYAEINKTSLDQYEFQIPTGLLFKKSVNLVLLSKRTRTNSATNRPSPGMFGRVAVVRTDVSEEGTTSVIRVTRISELGTTLAVTSNRNTQRRNIFLRSVLRLLVTATFAAALVAIYC